MGQTRKIQFQGREVTAHEVAFESSGEAFSHYQLEDGTSLKMKIVLLDVMRLEGEYSENGDPVYIFSAHQLTGIQAAEDLKKKK
jgi:hypothetical protein